MTTELLRQTWHQKPFKPFTIHMADGRAFHVPHPDFMALPPTGRIVIVFEADGTARFVDPLLMTEAEVHAPKDRTA